MSVPKIRITRRGEEVRPGAVPGLELLTGIETRAWLRCSAPTLYRLLRAGRLRGVHVGTSLRIYRASVIDYLAEQTATYRPQGSRATFGARRRELGR